MKLTPNTTADILVGPLRDWMYGKDPAVGIAYDDTNLEVVLVKGVTKSTKTLASSDWTELGSGFYKLSLSASEVGSEGELMVCVICDRTCITWDRRIDVGTDAVGGFTADDRTNLGVVKTKTDQLDFTGAAGSLKSESTNLSTLNDVSVIEVVAAMQEVGSMLQQIYAKLPDGVISDFDTATDTVTIDNPNDCKADLSSLNNISAADVVTAMQEAGTHLQQIFAKLPVGSLSDFDAVNDTVTVGNPDDCKADLSNLNNVAAADVVNAMQADGTYLKSIFSKLPAGTISSFDHMQNMVKFESSAFASLQLIAPLGDPSTWNFQQWLSWLVLRFAGNVSINNTSGLVVKDSGGSTVSSQAVSNDGTTKTVEAV